jgi:hypothetical protein
VDDTLATIEVGTNLPSSAQTLSTSRFDPKLAQPFIYKSVSEETRSAYHRAIREFFAFVGYVHPSQVVPSDVIAYRDHLRTNKRRKQNTVATKLAIVRSFFSHSAADPNSASNNPLANIGIFFHLPSFIITAPFGLIFLAPLVQILLMSGLIFIGLRWWKKMGH